MRTSADSPAVRWLLANPPEKRASAAIPALKENFGLDLKEAVRAIKTANDIRAKRRAPKRLEAPQPTLAKKIAKAVRAKAVRKARS
ncbi:hypothetical protein LB543_28015 [Mesorhizobium sp. ESP7-2]|uniref:hypothetical protein n=1 Tax=Mesorhizobium sp. ESP7-2 TaxID=2876622 RepID=UPI001CCC62B3|nr:hypothetical protein [Mesorhizobium sp. ESP7-2]MBZ9710548.1 hypothetical protein [Mesorhizobium sp. ESP7-2]